MKISLKAKKHPMITQHMVNIVQNRRKERIVRMKSKINELKQTIIARAMVNKVDFIALAIGLSVCM
jgi:uncharacterized membrane protein YecN with MAPEG domain